MSMCRVLILDCLGNDWTDRHLSKLENVDVDAIYRPVNLFLRVVRRIHFLLSLPLKSIWYGEWKNKLQDYDCIIIFATLFGNEIFKWIRKSGYCGRLILYYRDPQTAECLLPEIKGEALKNSESNLELWTFDPDDACRFALNYNPQFYFDLPIIKEDILYDAIYIGSSKERYDAIEKCYINLVQRGLEVRFWVKNDDHLKENSNGILWLKKNMEYEDVIKNNRKARAIVELNQAGQFGLTVRALEALFLKKKLITNNESIREIDFYNPQNIFIIGVDDYDDIGNWIKSPFKELPDNIKNKYTVESWLNRFLENKV